MASIPSGQGYDLLLADGQIWHLTASGDAACWLAEFARIMQLGASDKKGSGKVFFLRGPYAGRLEDLLTGSDNVPADLPFGGWSRYKSAVEVWYHENRQDYIINLGPKYVRQPGGENDITEEQHDVSQMSLSLFPFYWNSIDMGGLPFHAGLVDRDGLAVLLAASGGTGKSTCCRRIVPPWKALCDDEALITATKNGAYQVHPFPTWSDYIFERDRGTWNVDSHIPLSAIFFLEQSPEDGVAPMKDGIAASLIYRSSMQAYSRCLMGMEMDMIKQLRNKVFDNACVMAKTVPAYTLKVRIDGQFWEEIENVLPELRHL
jgi:SynChlorMet cassette protein ScmC